DGGGMCRRAPLLAAFAELRQEAKKRVGLSKFARSCREDPLLDPPEDLAKQRWCFPAQRLLDGAACCKVQRQYASAIAQLEGDPERRSRAAKFDRIFMPLKVFFILIVIAIGGVLAAWGKQIVGPYIRHVPRDCARVVLSSLLP